MVKVEIQLYILFPNPRDLHKLSFISYNFFYFFGENLMVT